MAWPRRVVRLLALVIAAAGLLWALALAVFGGIDTVIIGWKITSNEPVRPLAIAVFGLTMFVLANGVNRTHSLLATFGDSVDERWVVGALAICTFVVGSGYATTAASGLAPYSVVSEAELWFGGHLKQTMPWAGEAPWPANLWTFTPVGYGPTVNEDPWTIVPAASPGLPIIMAAAKRLGGQCAMFLVIPLFGAATILATYGVGRRLGWPRTGLIAAWLTATHPVFLEQLVLPTGEVALTGTAGLVAFFLLGRGLPSIVASGLCLAAAILIRPTVAPLAALVVVWLFMRDWSDASVTLGRRLRDASVFAVFATPGALAAAVIAQYLYGATIAPGDPRLIDSLSWSHALPWPWLALGAGVAVALVRKLGRKGLVLAAVGAVVWVGVYDLRLAARRGIFDRWRSDRAAIAAARLVRDRTDTNSVVFSLANSGSLRYYAGRVTLRWDVLDAGWLDHAVAWMSDQRVHAYALLDDAEVSVFRARFAGQQTAKLIDTPLLVYQGGTTLRFYDLAPSSIPPAGPETITESFRDPLRCVPPVDPPRLVLAR
jgi:hypothetical protein